MFRQLLALVLSCGMLAAPAPAQQATASHTSTGSITAAIPISGIIARYARATGISYYIFPDTPDPVINVALHDVSNTDSFEALLEINGLVSFKKGGMLFVGVPSTIDTQLGTKFTVEKTQLLSGIDQATLDKNRATLVPAGLVYYIDASNRTITMRGTKAAVEAFSKTLGQGELSSETHVKAIGLKNGNKASDLLATLTRLDPPVPPDNIVADDLHSQFLVRGSESYIARITKDIAEQDQPLTAILYNATIYEVDPDSFNSNIGTQVGQSTQTITSSLNSSIIQPGPPQAGQALFGFPIPHSFNLSGQINFLEQRGEAKILRRATVETTSGSTGEANYVTDFPFPVTDQYTGVTTPRTVRIGVTLRVTPTLGSENLTTAVYADYSDISGTGPLNYPIVVSRNGTVVVPTYGDDEILITGLYADDSTRSRTGLPGLDRIPILGSLFQNDQGSHSRTEIVMLLVPHVVHGKDRTLPVQWPHIPNDVLQQNIQPNPKYVAPTPTPAPAASTQPLQKAA